MIGAAIRKEFQLLRADKGGLASMFLLPLAFITCFGFMFRGSGPSKEPLQTLSIWAAPGAAATEKLVADVEAAGIFRVERATDEGEVAARVTAHDAAAGLVLPEGYGPGRAKAVVWVDEAQPRVAGPLVGALEGLLARAAFGGGAAAGAALPSLVEVRTPPGLKVARDDLDSFQISVPGNAVLFIFFLAMSVALSFVEDRKSGAWRRLLAAPVSRPTLLLAKLVPYVLIGLLQMAVFFGVGIVVFGMGVGGSAAGLVAVTLAVVCCAVALGLMVASFGGSEKQVNGFTTIAVLVMALLGGCMFPRYFMPPGMKALGLFTPHAWALDAYYDLLIRQGTTLADVATPTLVLFGMGAVFAAVGCLRFRFE